MRIKILLQAEVPEGRYCWEFRKDGNHVSCQFFDNEGGHPHCELGRLTNDNLKYTPEGNVEKCEVCYDAEVCDET